MREAVVGKVEKWEGRQKTRALGCAIFLAALLVYIPAMTAGFIWDDDQEITANPSLRSAAGLVEIWAGAKSADYFPLKTTMLWIEYHLWDIHPWPYHVVNILLHGVDAILVWLVLRRLRIPGAWLAGLFFAIHPVHAESVAWISERKNTLSLLFFLLSALAYFRFEKTENRRDYAFALAWSLAALLCKTHTVVLPAVLLLCAWWQRGAISRRDIARCAPFFLLAAVLGTVTVWFQYERAIGTETIPIGGFASRFAGAGMAVWWYLEKALLPVNLMEIYPVWHFNPPRVWQFAPVALLVILFALLWRARAHPVGRAMFFALAYFVVTLLPVLGFFKMSYMRHALVADHFQYFSDIGIIALCSAAGAELYRRTHGKLRHALAGGCVLLALNYSACSWQRASVHRSEETLWRDTLLRNPLSWQAHSHYGAAMFAKGFYPLAMTHFSRAMELKPDNPESHFNVGLLLAMQGRMDEAITQYREAVRIKDDPLFRVSLANALGAARQFREAVEQYSAVISRDPRNVEAHCNLGYAFSKMGRLDEAKAEFQKALEIEPGNEMARANLDLIERRKRSREE